MHKYNNNNNNILKALSFIFICSIFNTGYSQTFQADSVFTSPGIVIPNKSTGTPPPATFPTQDISSKPITTSYSCEAYRGQYDIDSQAIGIFKITREGNSLNKYYGQIIGTDNSGCYQACTPKTTTDLQSCESVNGAGWTGNYTTTTPFTCSAGGYLQQGTKSTSNNCAAPVLPAPVSCPENTTYCEGIGVGGGGVILKYGYLTYDKNTCKKTKTAVGSERFGSQELQERGSQDCPYPFGSYQEPDPICPDSSGLDREQGTISTACNIWGIGSTTGETYICTAKGWEIFKKGNGFMYICD